MRVYSYGASNKMKTNNFLMKFNPNQFLKINYLNRNAASIKMIKRNFYIYRFTRKKIFSITAISCLIYYYLNHKNDFSYFKSSSTSIKRYLNSILTSKEMKEGGTILLDHVFQDTKSKESMVNLFNKLFENPSAMKNSKTYGVKLFNGILNEQVITKRCNQIFCEIIKSPEFKYEGVDFTKYLLNHNESKELTAVYLRNIFPRTDINEYLHNIIINAGLHTIKNDFIKERSKDFLIDVWSDPSLRWLVIKKGFNIWERPQTIVNIEHINIK